MAPILAAFALAAAAIPFVTIHHLESSWNAYYLVISVTELLLFSFYKTYVYPKFLSSLRHLPQPKGALPLIGHDVALFQQPPAQDFGRWMQEVENDGLLSRTAPCGASGNNQDISNIMVAFHRFVFAAFLGLSVCWSRTPRPLLKCWLHELMTCKSHLLLENCAESS